MSTKLDILNLWNDPKMKHTIRTLWREYYGLYNERYNTSKTIQNKWKRNKIADDLNFAQTIGQDHLADSEESIAIGIGAITSTFREILMGSYPTTGIDQDPDNWITTDRLAAMGNGSDKDNRNLAFEVFKSGLFKLFNALVIGDFSHGNSAGIPGAIRFHQSKFQGYITDWLTFLTDAASNGKQYARKNGAWVEVIGGISPTIGLNGNWFIGETDTGVKAQGPDGNDGPDGEDGISPTIGLNGNWFIGAIDTGVKAQGPDGNDGQNGEDGISPTIGLNGNWFIGATDTGVKAQGPKGDNGTSVTVTQVPNLTLLSGSWSLVSGFYEYNLANANILATSIVEVIPDNASLDIVKTAEVCPRTDSSLGSVKLYSKNAPSGDIGVTINIF